MVSTNLGSRHDIKTNLKNVYDAVEAEDYPQAIVALDSLRYSIRTYYTTRGKPIDRFVDLWEDAEYLLRYATNNQHKRGLLEESIDKITMALRDEAPGDPNARLKELYEEIQHSYGLIGEDKSAPANIMDCFAEIDALREDFKDNLYFPSMCQYMANSIPLLIQVAKTERTPSALLIKLTEQFADLFIAIQRVLTPPMKLNITKEQIIQNIQAGIPLRDIADGIGVTEKELREMIEGNTEEDNDENKEE
jgi:hypothetical protein